jgi:hypothetical protein
MTSPAGLLFTRERDTARRHVGIVIAATVTIVVALYCWTRLGRGWVPHDEGTIAQSAERVLRHEVPHHDFIEVYTGGLSYLHAWAMQAFGQDLRAPREALFVLLVGWVPVLYYCIARFVPPFAAGGLTLLAVMWSYPAYPAALPSWYILFLATLGVAALLRYIDDPRWAWLALGGVAGGLAMLAKVSGIFFVAAVLLFLLYREQVLAAARPPDPRACRSRAWLAVLASGVLLLVVVLGLLVRPKWSAGMGLHFVLPSAALGAMMLAAEWRMPPATFRARLVGCLRTWLPFLAGAMLPLGLFALSYARRGQLEELLYGVFVLPARRVQFAAIRPPGPATLLAALPLAALLVPWSPLSRRRLTINVALLAGALFAVFLVSATSPWLYGRVWLSVRSLGPVAVVAGAFILARGDLVPRKNDIRRQRQGLVLWVLALMSLLQFPFSAPIYYCYVAPMVLLALVAIRPVHPTVPRSVIAVVVSFFIAFAIWRVHPGTVFSYGLYYEPDRQTEPLRLQRAGLTVTRDDQSTYERLIPLVEAHAENGVVLALPDAPEVSFLAGRANPTRALFEFFDAPMSADSIMSLVGARGVTAVVVNEKPSFSPALSPEVLEALRTRYPTAEQVGHFLVLW